MPNSEIELAALVGSRICHDLISPIGAVNNGLELLSMAGAGSSSEMTLIGESVDSASARIRFFRVAFGAAENQVLGASETNGILHDYHYNTRWNVIWSPTDPQQRTDIRMCFLALLCMETGMPYGGTITVKTSGGKWTLTGQADKLSIDPELWSVLATGQPAIKLRPAQVQFGLLPVIARDAGKQITSQILENKITLSF
ncbi:histidine phosphotransferase family protein [Sulfitobacter sp. CW3]|uniref:histidine phosphotransferase family protein n=1 Tax=Sulfitobacter sp. CW3 TaxID=2861965 RepID=UPI001C5FCCE6|nr:histidine phosphotransferase family protein [Sulfitobacter sp. CW3]MBW4960909.1 histidine phosphotransferase [Sulfitobacter sp. CW3]